ncbi:HEXXH motif domain-containing protein [Micromonospora endophytica]|uniref:HEXXH motif domain-containing protein n=1 Tax=Micromonospora endophytica TaxID=515350 RepID=UPI0015E8933C|nr:HEXXH motif domain-containing protein [Micromonospora endophytica]BCJ62748.1 HEXXH motif domain-containing protein [Micromonospora endophytica]
MGGGGAVTPGVHALPTWVLDELAAGRGGVTAVERLRAAQHSKTLLAVRALVLLVAESGHPDEAAVQSAYQLLVSLPPADRAAALGHPPVAAWAFGTASLLRRGASAATHPGLLAAVAATAAVRTGTDADLDVPLDPGAAGHLDLPGLGTVLLPPSATRARVRVADGRARVFGAGERIDIGAGRRAGPRWRPVPRWSVAHHGLPLTLLVESRTWRHVPASDAGHRIGGTVTGVWRSRLAGAWRILVDQHRPVAAEVSAALCVLAPIPAPTDGTHSGTFHHAFGAVAMSVPPDARSAAATLAHEIQHLKLAALNDMFTLVEPGPRELFYAPWRPDPRPLEALLHGAYAHLGVAGFWRRQARMAAVPARHHAEVEFVRWTRAADDTVRVLAAQRRLTPVGRRLVDGMAGVLDRWAAEPVTPQAAVQADRLLAAHRARWEPSRTPTARTRA